MEKQLEVDLMEVVRDLSPENIRQVLDYADYLRNKSRISTPPRGSAQALLLALEQVGPLAFAPGELEARLAEIQTMREMDRQNNDRLSA